MAKFFFFDRGYCKFSKETIFNIMSKSKLLSVQAPDLLVIIVYNKLFFFIALGTLGAKKKKFRWFPSASYIPLENIYLVTKFYIIGKSISIHLKLYFQCNLPNFRHVSNTSAWEGSAFLMTTGAWFLKQSWRGDSFFHDFLLVSDSQYQTGVLAN